MIYSVNDQLPPVNTNLPLIFLNKKYNVPLSCGFNINIISNDINNFRTLLFLIPNMRITLTNSSNANFNQHFLFPISNIKIIEKTDWSIEYSPYFIAKCVINYTNQFDIIELDDKFGKRINDTIQLNGTISVSTLPNAF